MALEKSQLQTNLGALFKAAYDQSYDQDKVAAELAALIDSYVRNAEITGVQVSVTDATGTNIIGSGTQTNSVKLK